MWAAAPSEESRGGHGGVYPEHHSRDHHRQSGECPSTHTGTCCAEAGVHQQVEVPKEQIRTVTFKHLYLQMTPRINLPYIVP